MRWGRDRIRLAEHRHIGGVEIHGHHVQFPFQPPKIVGSSPCRQRVGEKAFKRGVGKKAGWNDRAKCGKEAKKGKIARIEKVVAQGGKQGSWYAAQSTGVFPDGGTEKNLGF